MPSSLLALLDDITTILDDVSVFTKVAATKTVGVVGDDLALNAQQVVGVASARELPVVWAVAKGSLVNKAILVPTAVAISAVAPWAVQPLLMVGGTFLCFEGFEKVAHRSLNSGHEEAADRVAPAHAITDPAVALVALERDKIKGAIRTDFVLSAEIIAIALGVAAAAPLATRIGVLVGISLLMTVGVYGLVAGIVKLDDAGLHLSRRPGLQRRLGEGIVTLAPWLMKGLSIVGTIAMFLVGGGIMIHGIPGAHHAIEHLQHPVAAIPGAASIVGIVADLLCGVVAGGIVVGMVELGRRLFRPRGK